MIFPIDELFVSQRVAHNSISGGGDLISSGTGPIDADGLDKIETSRKPQSRHNHHKDDCVSRPALRYHLPLRLFGC